MIDEALQREWFRDSAQRVEETLPTVRSDALGQLRARARVALDEIPVISRRQEDWRYTRIDSLLEQDLQPDKTAVDTVSLPSTGYQALPVTDAHRLVFVNGHYAPHLSNHSKLPEGVVLCSLRESLKCNPEQVMRWLGSLARHDQHLFNALNTALIDDGLFLHVDRNISIDRPIELVSFGATCVDSSLAQLRNLIVLEAGARVELVEHFTGEETAHYFHNGLTEILLEEGATLKHVRFQNEAPGAWHLGSLYLSLKTGSHYQGVPLVFGGAWSRTEYQVNFAGEAAGCELDGLYTVGGGQLSDIHLNISHRVPSCTSRFNFRGLLHGKGRAVFDGCIRVGETAQHTDARLRNDNLMLAPDAEIDTKPRLEIDADNVKCSHGTTVGQLDPQQWFYLRSRGLDEAAARTLLALGFASEIIQVLDNDALRAMADSILHGLLDATEQKMESA